MQELLSLNQACRALSIGRTKLYDLVNSGRLPVVRIGRRVLVSRQALETFVASLAVEA